MPQKSKLKSNFYEITNSEIKRKNPFCPKCGPGVFMASHKDRYTCGKCGFMQKK